MRWFLALPLILLTAAAPPDQLQQIPPGRYEFRPLLPVPPGYACREVWTITADGTLHFESGQQRTVMRLGYDDDWLAGRVAVFTPAATNGLPDCNGNRRDPADHEERRFEFTREADGAIRLCHLPFMREERGTTDEDGTPMPDWRPPEPGSCPGRLYPVRE